MTNQDNRRKGSRGPSVTEYASHEAWRLRRFLRWIREWLFVLLHFAILPCLAGPIKAETLIKDVANVERSSLGGHLEIFRSSPDVSAEFVVEKHASDFQKIPRLLSQGFTSDAVWVSFTLQNKTLTEPQEVWVEFGQPLIRNIQFYAWGEGGPEFMSGRLPRRHREHAFD